MRREPDDLTARTVGEETQLFSQSESLQSAPTGEPDPIELLWNDHDRIELLFDEYDGDEGKEAREDLKRILSECRIHIRLEEEFLHPLVMAEGGPEVRGVLGESVEEHGELKKILARLEGGEPGDPAVEQAMTDLETAFEAHLEHEEEHLYPTVRDILARNDITDLGERMLKMRKRLEAGDA